MKQKCKSPKQLLKDCNNILNKMNKSKIKENKNKNICEIYKRNLKTCLKNHNKVFFGANPYNNKMN